jgi:glycosyltransferase involved in cell wall biosynthesis
MYETSSSKGQELVAQRMVREFNRLGHDAFLITSAFHDWEPVVSEDEIARCGGYTHTFDEKLGIPVLRVGSEIASWPPRRVLFRNFMGVVTRIVADLKLNVLVTHSTLWNGPEEVAKFVAWNRQLARQGAYNPPILFCHMSHFQEASDERYTVEERTFRETWNRISLEEIVHQADYVIVTTPLEKEQIKKLGAAEDKFILLPGGIDDEIFEGRKRGSFKQRLGLPDSAKLVTFLGTIEERKNVLSVVEVARACAQSKNVHFVIAGKMEGEYAKKVKAAAEGAGNITILGEITDEDKANLIDGTFVNLTMSRSEALGIAQLEFMYRGVPVITSGVGGQSWLVRNDVNGVVLSGPDDIKGASSAVTFLLANSKSRKKLSKGALRTSSQATLSNLIAGLSKKLLAKLSNEPGTPTPHEAREKLIEAKVNGNRKVAVTTKRLIMSSVKQGKSLVSIPYAEITRVSRQERRPWASLLIGLGMSAGIFTAEVLAPALPATMLSSLESILGIGASSIVALVSRIVVPLTPVFVAAVMCITVVKDGYVIYYGKGQELFVDREFGRVLRIANSLTENRLFASGLEGLETG